MNLGQVLYQRMTVECPGCSHGMSSMTYPGSLFLILTCRENDCEYQHCTVLVEKATMQVIQQIGWRMVNGKPAWPSHFVDRKGFQILPESGQVTGG